MLANTRDLTEAQWKILSLSAFVCVLFLTASFCRAQTSYKITDLGTLTSDGYSVAQSINATGEVTGFAGNNDTNVSDVFLYSNGTMTNLGTLGGKSGIGLGINKSSGTHRIRAAPTAHSSRATAG